VDIAVTVLGGSDGDEVRGLRRWLGVEDEFRGRIQLLEPGPEPGQLGTLADTLIVGLGSGGAATVMASALVPWVRHRTGDTRAVLRKPDGREIDLAAQRISGDHEMTEPWTGWWPGQAARVHHRTGRGVAAPAASGPGLRGRAGLAGRAGRGPATDGRICNHHARGCPGRRAASRSRRTLPASAARHGSQLTEIPVVPEATGNGGSSP
jgi:Effector Associated Constant Component 1